MASLKLTKTMREEIQTKILKHAFQEREEELNKRLSTIALRVYEDIYPKKQREAMDALPKGWLPSRNQVTAKMGKDQEYYKTFRLEKNVCVPYTDIHSCSKVYDDEHPLAVLYQKYVADKDAFSKEWQDMKRRTWATLESVTMTGKLKALWPEIEKFVTEVENRYGGSYHVPSTTIVELNSRLNLPPEGEKKHARN